MRNEGIRYALVTGQEKVSEMEFQGIQIKGQISCLLREGSFRDQKGPCD